jgi:hypothetical protein
MAKTPDTRRVLWDFFPGERRVTKAKPQQSPTQMPAGVELPTRISEDVWLQVTDADGTLAESVQVNNLPSPSEMPSGDRLDEKEARHAGRLLWDRLPKEVTGRLAARLTAAKSGVPVALDLQLRTSWARDLPWELLADDDGPIALRPQCRVRRLLPTPLAAPPLTVRPPLRVVVVLTNPKDELLLQPTVELGVVTGALGRPGYQMNVVLEPTLAAIKHAFEQEPHIVHYIGHAGLSQGQGNLILHDEHDQTVWLPPAQAGSLLPATTRLVCLSTCVSQLNYEIRGLPRMAQAPPGAQLPTTVATQFQLEPNAATVLWQSFYSQLLLSGGDAGEAVHAARAAVWSKFPRWADWASFTLVLRDGSSRPFRLLADSRAGLEATPKATGAAVESRQALELRAQFAVRSVADLTERLRSFGDAAPDALRDQLKRETEVADNYVRRLATFSEEP